MTIEPAHDCRPLVARPLVIFVIAVALAGCADDIPGSRPTYPGTSSANASPRSAQGSHDNGRSPQARAVGAYKGMWDDFVAAARTSNADDPRLRHHASGAALALIRRGLRSDRAKDVVTRGELTLRPRVVSMKPPTDPRRVRIRDCVDGTRWLTHSRHGERATGPAEAGQHRVEAVVTRKAGAWKVSAFFAEAAGTC